MSTINKVDMSLDDIIKLNKKQRGQGQGRGRLGRGNTAGTGRGGKTNKIKQFRTNLQRGGTRGRGTRGRGRLRRLSSGVSPLNRPEDQSTSTSPNKQGYQNQGYQKESLKQQRLQAVLALKKAKQQLQRIDAQATKRQNFVNQRRGIQQQTSQVQYQNNRGQGRGRGGRGRLSRQNYNQRRNQNTSSGYYQNTNYTAIRGRGRGRGQLRRLGVGAQNYASNLSLNSSAGQLSTGTRKKRQWRQRPVQSPVSQNDGILTISLPNSDYQQPPTEQQQQSTSQKYNYNKRLFAQPSTNVSLSERFNQTSEEGSGRQVFL